jgi:hypothetical protein
MALAAFGTASAASSQSVNQAILAYRAAQASCAEQYRQRTAGSCDERCIGAAERGQTSCMAGAERRYRSILRRELRSRL